MLEQETVKRPDRANLLPPENQRVHNAFYLKGNSPLILTSPNSFRTPRRGGKNGGDANRFRAHKSCGRKTGRRMRALTRQAWSGDVALGSSNDVCAVGNTHVMKVYDAI